MDVFLLFSIKILLCTCVVAFNLDTTYPIVYVDPSVAHNEPYEPTYFGYSLILYSGDRRLDDPWLKIGAPKGNDSAVNYPNPGVVYHCNIKEPCVKVENPLEKGRYRDRSYLLYNSWHGGTMDYSYASNKSVICAQKWTVMYKGNDDDLALGSCYWSPITGKGSRVLTPLDKIYRILYTPPDGLSFYDYGQGVAGVSVSVTDDNRVIIGAPGVYAWSGTGILYSDPDDPLYAEIKPLTVENVGNPRLTREIDASDLTGYAVSSGHFFNQKRTKESLLFVISAPRAKQLLGHVLLFRFNQKNNQKLNVVVTKQGSQVGEYFGGSITVGDINYDGFDDLIVGSPYYASQDYNEGRISIFLGGDGALQKPNIGATINGLAANGLFGLDVKFAGDMNLDSFGDVVVAAPNELEGSGVVYVYLGSKAGLTVTPTQRIVGRNFVPNIRGFGMALSKLADIDMNNYLDLAIGAYRSGHVVLLRGRAIAHVKHSIKTDTKQLHDTDKTFNVTVCLWMIPRTFTGDVEMKVKRILSVDEELGRAFIRPQDQEKDIYLMRKMMDCENITVTMSSKNNSNFYDPIKVSVSHEFIDENDQGEVIFVGNNTDDDRLCLRCPVYDPYSSSKKESINVPFALGCADAYICTANLQVDTKLLNIGANSEDKFIGSHLINNLNFNDNNDLFILGSEEFVTLEIKVRNTGEKAYLTQLMITLPDAIHFRQYQKNCHQDGTSVLYCDVGNPLVENSERKVPIELEMKGINTGSYGNFVEIALVVTTSSRNIGDSSKNLTLKLIREADITISGKSEKQSYNYGNATFAAPNFTQIFEVEKVGLSPLDEVTITISVPYKLKGGQEHFLGLYPPEGYLGGQPLMCRSSFDYVMEAKLQGDSDVQLTMPQNEFYPEPKGGGTSKRSARSVEDADVEVFQNSTLEYQRTWADGDSYDFNSNRTLSIDCGREDVVCSEVVCDSGPYLKDGDRDQNNAVLQIRMELYTKHLKDLLVGKDLIILSTHGSVTIKNPPNFIQSGDRPDEVTVSSLFVGETKQTIAIWIIIVAVVVGLLILLLITLGLIKAGFFKRKKKEELENLKTDVKYRESMISKGSDKPVTEDQGPPDSKEAE